MFKVRFIHDSKRIYYEKKVHSDNKRSIIENFHFPSFKYLVSAVCSPFEVEGLKNTILPRKRNKTAYCIFYD